MTLRNTQRVVSRLNKLPANARAGIGKAIAISLLELDGDAKRRISTGARSGRVYKRGKSRTHQASAAGEYPKSDTGQLVSSLFFRQAADKLSGFFGTRLNYGRYLEYGTTRMSARSWLRPTFRRLEAGIKARVREAVKRAMGGI